MAQHEEDAMNLNQMLDDIAHRVAIDGTTSEAAHLQHLAHSVEAHAPGVAAALVDWDGPEVARARAFGIASGIAIHGLSPWDQTNLMADMLGVARSTVAA